MNKKVLLLWENFSGRRQTEESHTKNTQRKNCNFCGKMFRTTGNLKKHIQKTHVEKSAIFVENVSDQRQFEETHEKYI